MTKKELLEWNDQSEAKDCIVKEDLSDCHGECGYAYDKLKEKFEISARIQNEKRKVNRLGY